MVIVSFASLFLFFAVNLYVVVSLGLTCDEPCVLSTRPMPLISTVSAFSTCHRIVEVCPDLMVAGFAVYRRIRTRFGARVVTVVRAVP